MCHKSLEARPRSLVKDGDCRLSIDFLIKEEPLDLLMESPETEDPVRSLCMLMRTPGADRELALGFLFTEGILRSRREVLQARVEVQGEHRVIISSREGYERSKARTSSGFPINSGCGLCSSISQSTTPPVRRVHQSSQRVFYEEEILLSLPRKMKNSQKLFHQSGGVHASALFSATGELISLFEDVGRHNALDKLIGHSILSNENQMERGILLLSGRVSFDLIQKASQADIPVVAAMGAPSNSAAQAANEAGITLVGFLKNQGFNIYSGWERIRPEKSLPLLKKGTHPQVYQK